MTIVPPSIALEIGLVRAALEADYEVLEELGRGGMAVVYKARDKHLEREVAIKVLPFTLAFDNDFVDRFQHEARTAGQLEHPNVVPIYRVGRSGQVIFFVMKLLRGQSLSSVIRERGKLAPSEVRRIILDTAAALGYASRSGVVHRDIKPDNILFDNEGRCVVTDFGIAKTSGTELTAQGTSMGTPRYMSPEHAQGIPLDGRSDIYSLGVVAFQCLTGSIPFDGPDPFAVLYKHVNAPLPRPEFATDDEKSLFAVIEKMLEKKPDDRFQNSDELIVALGGEVTSPVVVGSNTPRPTRLTPTQIMITPITGRLWRYGPTHWRFWAAAAGIVLLAGGGFGFYMWKSQRTELDTTLPTPTMIASPPIVAPRPAPPPEPFSRCAQPGTIGEMSLLVDAIRDQKVGGRLAINYDVCGLARGAAFTTDIIVQKVSQSRFRRMVGGAVRPATAHYIDVASGPRTRRRRAIALEGLPAGEYTMTVIVVDAASRRKERTRNLNIVD
jgi:serine/threonine protein kinase